LAYYTLLNFNLFHSIDLIIFCNGTVHCDTWQAWSRVKDPNGKEESLVFALGCCVEDCRNVVKWGFNRSLKISERSNGKKVKVEVSCKNENITKPQIIHCKNFEDMGNQAMMFKQSKNKGSFSGKPSISLIIDGSCKKTPHFLDSFLDLVKLMSFRRDSYGLQTKEGGYLTQKFPLTDRDLEDHIKGIKTIGTYQLNENHEVSWIAFDVDSHGPKAKKDRSTGEIIPVNETLEQIEQRDSIAEENKDRLYNTLQSLKIPFVLEASGSVHSYHFIIFLAKPIEASLASFIGTEIKKHVGLKGDIELFPKQVKLTQKKYGNLLKLPFATHRKTGKKSKIMVNGDFVSEFKGLEIELIDLSPLAALAHEQQEEVRKKVKTAKNEFKKNYPDIRVMPDGFVRPCFMASQFKQMNHGDGNQFRIAAAGELYRAGYPLDVAVQYFKYQGDFDEEETRYRLELVYSGNYQRTNQEKLKNLCPRFVNCDNCGYDGICDYLGRGESLTYDLLPPLKQPVSV